MYNCSIIIGFFVSLLVPWGSALSETISSSDYLPLADGNSWTFSVTGTNGAYTVTILPGTTSIKGVPTKAVQSSDGYILYLTSDAAGIRLHGEFDSTDSSSLTYVPPLVWVKGTANIPDTSNSSGVVEVDIPWIGSGTLNYTYTSTLEAMEAVTVLAGLYDTIRYSDSLNMAGNFYGQKLNLTWSTTTWLARYIGEIKEITNDDSGQETYVLTSTNVKPQYKHFGLPFLQLLLE